MSATFHSVGSSLSHRQKASTPAAIISGVILISVAGAPVASLESTAGTWHTDFS
jgi:hypothetical protein